MMTQQPGTGPDTPPRTTRCRRPGGAGSGQPGELGSVRLRKNTLGVYRLDNDSGQHDD
ncbi:MAG TPA: hypothetical protein VGI96_48660 [Streptosporangiaceae bacterium]